MSDAPINKKGRLSANRVHRWLGVACSFWLLVIAATGFFLNGAFSSSVSGLRVSRTWLPDVIARAADESRGQFLQASPRNPGHWLMGDATGVWRSSDHGSSWAAVNIEPMPSRIYALSTSSDWSEVWLATQEGLYLSLDQGEKFRLVGLQGRPVTAISADDGILLAAVDHSDLWLNDQSAESPDAWQKLELGPRPNSNTVDAPSRGVSQFLMDLHFGRGLFGRTVDAKINDLAAIGLFSLAVSGFLFWFIRRIHFGRRWMKNLLRIHAYALGLLCALPIVLAASSGLILDHLENLRPKLASLQIPAAILPPAFHLATWNEQIETVGSFRQRGHLHLLVGTRLGLYTSRDRGETWNWIVGSEGNASLLVRRVGQEIFSLGQKSGRTQRVSLLESKAFGVPHSIRHQDDVSQGSGVDQLLWKSRRILLETDLRGTKLGQSEFIGPMLETVPLMPALLEIHKGVFLGAFGNWLNDFFALSILALVFTGLWRLSHRHF